MAVLLVATTEGAVRKYDAESGAAHAAAIRDVCTSVAQPWASACGAHPGDVLIALMGQLSSGGANAVAAISTATGRVMQRFHGQDALTCVAAHGSVLWAAGTAGGRVCVWDTRTGALLLSVEGAHLQAVSALSFAADGVTLVSAGRDGRLRLWPVHRSPCSAPVVDIDAHGAAIVGMHVGFGVGMAFRVYTVAEDGSAAAWDAVDGAALFRVRVAGASCIAVNAAETALFLGCADGCVRVLPVGDDKADCSVLSNEGAVASLALSHDGRMLAVANRPGSVAVWLLAGGTRCSLLRRITLPDGQTLGGHIDFVPPSALVELRTDNFKLGHPGRVPLPLTESAFVQLPSVTRPTVSVQRAEPEDVLQLKRGYARLLDHVFSTM